MGFVGQLADGKLRCSVGTLGGHKGIQIGALHPFNKAQTPHTGKLLGHVARQDEAAKRVAIHPRAGGKEPARSTQYMQHMFQPPVDLGLGPK